MFASESIRAKREGVNALKVKWHPGLPPRFGNDTVNAGGSSARPPVVPSGQGGLDGPRYPMSPRRRPTAVRCRLGGNRVADVQSRTYSRAVRCHYDTERVPATAGGA